MKYIKLEDSYYQEWNDGDDYSIIVEVEDEEFDDLVKDLKEVVVKNRDNGWTPLDDFNEVIEKHNARAISIGAFDYIIEW